MSKLRVLYRRTFSYAPYETQVIELDYEEETDLSRSLAMAQFKKLYDDLQIIGDGIMVDALGKKRRNA